MPAGEGSAVAQLCLFPAGAELPGLTGEGERTGPKSVPNPLSLLHGVGVGFWLALLSLAGFAELSGTSVCVLGCPFP